MYEQGYGTSSAGREDDSRLKIESQQMKDDIRALRERNYKLHEENLKLREGVRQEPERSRPRSKSPLAMSEDRMPKSSYVSTSSPYSEGKLLSSRSANLGEF